MNTFRKSLVKVVALAFLSILYCPVYAACNTLTSRTDLPPDRASTVYITLQQDGPGLGTSDLLCQAQFDTPAFNITPRWTTTTKCNALENAIRTQCPVTSGFTILNNSCNSLQTFTLQGTKATTAVILGISNTGFGADKTGTILPNYEREIVTPGCTADGTGGGLAAQALVPIQALLATKGTATGVSFIAGQPAAINVVVVASNGGVTTAQVNTTAGMTAASIVSQLNTQLAQAGVSCSVVTNPFAAILCTQPSAGSANGFGITTSDTGIGVGNASGPADTIMNAFNGPAFENTDIPLPLPALVVLASLLAGSGIVVGRRKRK